MWSMKKVEIVPVVIGAFGAVSKNFEQYMERLGIQIKTEHLQKTALLGTARILRRTLESRKAKEKDQDRTHSNDATKDRRA